MIPFRIRWVASCALAELVGIGFGAAIGSVVGPILRAPASLALKLVLVVAATSIGLVEGGALGMLQGRLLRERLPRLRAREWAAPTVLFAALGWGLGMIRPSLGQGEAVVAQTGAEPPLLVVLALAGVFGGAAGALLGAAQWSVLRRHAPRAGRWILVNVGAWALAMIAIFAGFTIPDDATSTVTRLLLGALGGVTGGTLLGLVTAPLAGSLEPWVDEAGTPLAGKIAVVTGATSGIGFEIALGLARLGAEIVLLGRDARKLAATRDAITHRVSRAVLHTVVVDLAANESIDRAATAIAERVRRIDLLVHDAGATFSARTVSVDGTEATVAIDALGPARLTAALDSLLAPGARVAVLTGIYQRRGEVHFDDLAFAHRAYSSGAANAQAQRARFLFVAALAERRPDLVTFAVHPGAVHTEALDRAPLWARALAATLARPAFVRPELGALPVLRLLTTKATVPSGRFWNRFSITPDVPTRDEGAARALFGIALTRSTPRTT